MLKLAKRQLCQATKAGGQPCQAPAIKQGYCFSHAPELAEKARQARILGGKNKAQAVRLRKLVPPRLIPVYNKLESALNEVYAGKLDPRAASAMASLAGAMVRVLTSGELEERVRSLEESSKNGSNHNGKS